MKSLALRSVLFLLLMPAALAAQQAAPQPTTAAQAPNQRHKLYRRPGHSPCDARGAVAGDNQSGGASGACRAMPDQGPPESLADRRSHTDAYTAAARVAWTKICPNTIVEDKIAGVPVRIVTPDGMPDANRDKVLMNLHGGGFNSDSGSYTESIPIASYTEIKVVAVLYRLAPENPFPAAVDDSVAVYKELLKTYKPDHIVIYGTSAGAILTAEVAVKLKQLGLPMPAALGIFSGMGDFARHGDSTALYALRGLSGHLDPPAAGRTRSRATWQRPIYDDPVLSPDLRRFARAAANAVCDQRARPAAERNLESASGFSASGSGCAADGLRCADTRVLVRPQVAGSD